MGTLRLVSLLKKQLCTIRVQARVENKKKRLGSFEFWEILNKIFNRGKAFITSSYKKARLFAMNIVVNYRLDSKSDPLPDF